MWVYIVRRLIFLPVILLAVSLITFTLGVYGPGDPVRVSMGNKYNPAAAERIRAELGLNRPFFVQYADYMFGFFQGDFGESLRFIGQPVRDLYLVEDVGLRPVIHRRDDREHGGRLASGVLTSRTSKGVGKTRRP